jgi:hypothetical protein
MLRLLVSLLLNLVFGNPDRVAQDRRPWPTWVVVVLLLLLLGAVLALFVYPAFRSP